MEIGHNSEDRQWNNTKPKSCQQRSRSEEGRGHPETPRNPPGSHQAHRSFMGGRKVPQDSDKPRSRQWTGAGKPQTRESGLDLQQIKMFSAEEVSKVIKSVLEKELLNAEYEATGSNQRAMELAQLVKESVRLLGYERYKIVCYIVLGPVSQTALYCCSRSVWSPNSDTYAEYVFQNQSLFAVCVVYGGYYE
ncbi:hypothetical protein GDO86_007646 [Hymenochirus boettgeri]|uniref:Uncharacterized protein n=1 Tax=Hymenochirus boettgeri TaxID=247094 RepID=A0A8T2J015_9PIPI|nr:hypothetical protein GDO86_007646 [Hymenochirus boettgeri]